jgi:hypothetical protein
MGIDALMIDCRGQRTAHGAESGAVFYRKAYRGKTNPLTGMGISANVA